MCKISEGGASLREFEIMAENLTPRKLYFRGSKQSACSICRMCLKVCDPKNAKNIFSRVNSKVLAIAEDLLGKPLPRGENLPHRLCKPCERRLNNYSEFKTLARNSQNLITADSTAKRCKEMFPSTLPPAKRPESKRETTAAKKSRRSLILHDSNELEVRSSTCDYYD